MSLRVVPCECSETHCYIGSGRCVGCYKQRRPSPVTSRSSPVWVEIEEVELDRLADDGCPHHGEPCVIGQDGDEEDLECDYCGGRGVVGSRTGIGAAFAMDCPECGGTGWC